MQQCSPGPCRPVLHDGEWFCGRCGFEIKDMNEERTYVTTEDAKMLHSMSHHPEAPHMHAALGSGHDMTSPANYGIVMEACRQGAKDFNKKPVVKELFADPYTTGQTVGKGAFVVEFNRYFVTLSCNKHTEILDREPYAKCKVCCTVFENREKCIDHITEKHKSVKPQARRKHVEDEPIECKTCKKTCTPVRIYEYPVNKPVVDMMVDTTYHSTKTVLEMWLKKLGADDIDAMTVGETLRKRFYRGLEIWKSLQAIGTILEVHTHKGGLFLEAEPELVAEYNALLKQVKSFLFEVLPQQLGDDTVVTIKPAPTKEPMAPTQ